MPIILCYDVSDKEPEFRAALLELGYRAQIAGKRCKFIYFPKGTLYHASKTPTQARTDSQTICTRLQIKLQRCISTHLDPGNFAAVCGEEIGGHALKNLLD